MRDRDIEVALAARLYRAGLAKILILRAFSDSIAGKTSFIDELYASARGEDAVIGQCIADVAGVVFEYAPQTTGIFLRSGPDITVLPHARIATTLTPDSNALIYIAPTIEDIAFVKRRLSGRKDVAARLRVTTPSGVRELLRIGHQELLADKAARMIEDFRCEYSAKTVLTGQQGILIGMLITCLLLDALEKQQFGWRGLHVFFSLFFLACVLLRLVACKSASGDDPPPLPAISPAELPVYTVMIALYQEADVVPQLVKAMLALNWPRSKLQVLFLCEADDAATLTALRCQVLPQSFDIIPIAGYGPRTKPKALNYGLLLSKGAFVVVYDAEDRPHPDQLLEAFQHFQRADEKLGCLQAPLKIANAHESLVARMFAFEYAAHFQSFLPWLAHRGLVLPLGGSSNHFRYDCLIAIGGWDPHNVTEDAELGTRLARLGYRADMIARATLEDAPAEAGVWFRQRTRWFKGWIQTWLVQMRKPFTVLAQLGFRRFIVYQLLAAGMIVSSLLYPLTLLFMLSVSFCWLSGSDVFARHQDILCIDLINIVMGYLSFHRLGQRALAGATMPGRILPWIPLYWLLMSLAAWRALGQLNTRPFLWEKTPHRPARSTQETPDRNQ
ncbi:cellulose synthase/poly-beta-1,6-N-acetylglucosamine synthase-like glycosyltransferase [Phyllobacterium myrsinacearum]|uniref:glycosyltransferase n=1 Tax=Phyllobacterium myrsinacearum TaxID=28101 RepID=UPI00102A12D5|nr:glycosyltransferase [Phyllobacterium myrsinacearum]RZS88044.1 cellulose synthase/poly-beta-1,6-N-acetylglucosamine synthase-like glycosyltransferase [Phyllobacterium myrsinacearum]